MRTNSSNKQTKVDPFSILFNYSLSIGILCFRLLFLNRFFACLFVLLKINSFLRDCFSLPNSRFSRNFLSFCTQEFISVCLRLVKFQSVRYFLFFFLSFVKTKMAVFSAMCIVVGEVGEIRARRCLLHSVSLKFQLWFFFFIQSLF